MFGNLTLQHAHYIYKDKRIVIYRKYPLKAMLTKDFLGTTNAYLLPPLTLDVRVWRKVGLGMESFRM